MSGQPISCLVTGADGFIGRNLVPYLEAGGCSVTSAVRVCKENQQHRRFVEIGDIGRFEGWPSMLENQQVVIHLANKAHFPLDSAIDIEGLHQSYVDGTLDFASAAAASGVRRFIYLSSIKVNGEQTQKKPFNYNDPPNPQDTYALLKWKVEEGLRHLCEDSQMELVIIRPPLVYGLGVKGNLRTLKQVIDRGWPLPLAGIKNQRDLISLSNLVDLISVCIEHPDALGHTFLCSDDQSISTTELIADIARAQQKKPKLFRVPQKLLAALSKLTGKEGSYERLFGDLRVDISHTKKVLGWSPPFTYEESIKEAFKPNN